MGLIAELIRDILAEGIVTFTGAALLRATGNDRRSTKKIAEARANACMLAGGFFWLGVAAVVVILIFR